MADTITSVYEFTLPEVGGSEDTWGTKLNANWADVETLLISGFEDGTPTNIGKLKGGSIAETITGPHTFSGQVTFTSFINLENPAPQIRFTETDQEDPAGRWRFVANAGTFYLGRANVAGGWPSEQQVWVINENFTPTRFTVNALYDFHVPAKAVFGSTTVVGETLANHFRLKEAAGTTGISVIARSDTTGFYLLLTDSGDADGSFNDLRPFSLNKTTGAVAINTSLSVGGSGLSGDGSGLTALNASQLTSGTVPNGRLAGNYDFNGLTLTGSLSTAGNVVAGNAFVAPPGGGTPLYIFSGDLDTGIGRAASDSLSFYTGGTEQLRIGPTGIINALNGTFLGLGNGLTNLNASELTSGTIANARLAGNYTFNTLTLSGTLTAENVGASGILYCSGQYVRAPGTLNTPTFTFEGNVGTGMGRGAANVLTFYTTGAERARIDSAGVFSTSGNITPGGHVILPTTGSVQFGSASTRIQPVSTDGPIQMFVNGAVTARVEVGGTGVPLVTSIITREKGDNRYAPIASSIRYKDGLEPAELPVAGFMDLSPYWWVWGGELDEHNPRRGKHGFGLVAEEVGEVFPEAVITGGNGKIEGLDPLPLIGALFAEIKALKARLSSLEERQTNG